MAARSRGKGEPPCVARAATPSTASVSGCLARVSSMHSASMVSAATARSRMPNKLPDERISAASPPRPSIDPSAPSLSIRSLPRLPSAAFILENSVPAPLKSCPGVPPKEAPDMDGRWRAAPEGPEGGGVAGGTPAGPSRILSFILSIIPLDLSASLPRPAENLPSCADEAGEEDTTTK